MHVTRAHRLCTLCMGTARAIVDYPNTIQSQSYQLDFIFMYNIQVCTIPIIASSKIRPGRECPSHRSTCSSDLIIRLRTGFLSTITCARYFQFLVPVLDVTLTGAEPMVSQTLVAVHMIISSSSPGVVERNSKHTNQSESLPSEEEDWLGGSSAKLSLSASSNIKCTFVLHRRTAASRSWT